jgi:UDP-3-O-[3-hydroxymyristoyl] glucosamine N-acyltransferase
MGKTIAQWAEWLGGTLVGDGSAEIRAVAGLREAQAGDLSFFTNRKYLGLLAKTSASAVLVAEDFQGETKASLIRVPNPDAAFAKVTGFFCTPPPVYAPGVDASARVHPSARLGEGVHVGPCAVIQAGASVGDRTVVQAGVYIGENARIGADGLLSVGAVLRENVILGNRVIIHNNTVIGSEGFGYSVDDKGVRTKVPQVGIVRVGDDVEIGACVCVDRARFGETRIGNGVKIDNLVQIAHNVIVQDHAVLVAQVGISGSSVVEHHAILAGQVGVAGHLTIGAGAVVGAQGGVTKDVAPKAYVWGTPAAPFDKYSQNLANLNRLPKLIERVARLEAKLQALGGETPPA